MCVRAVGLPGDERLAERVNATKVGHGRGG